MVVRRSRKVRKFRGKRTYGYGCHKKHRGKGSRGGRGLAGMHKQKWSYTIKYDREHFGKRGFVRPVAAARVVRAIDLRQLEKLAAASGKRKLELKEFGYDKVLGSGRIGTALEVTAAYFSKKAKEKIEAAGGKANIAKSPEKKEISTEKSPEKKLKEIKREKTEE